MKAVIAFLIVVVLGFGFVQFVSWLVAELSMHVFHVHPGAPPKLQ